jgi:hypothetical protein
VAVRVRRSGTILCAAQSDPEPGDVYLDDGAHYWLSRTTKLIRTDDEGDTWRFVCAPPPDDLVLDPGFVGIPLCSVSMTDEDYPTPARHGLSLVVCAFPDGSCSTYVWVREDHDGHRGTRLLCLSAAVHALRNLPESEAY